MAGRWPPNLLLTHSVYCVRVGEKRVKGRTARPNAADNGFGDNFMDDGWQPSGERRTDNGHADPDGYEKVEAWDCHVSCPVKLMDEQSGQSKSPTKDFDYTRSTNTDERIFNGTKGKADARLGEGAKVTSANYGDQGGASRFFPVFSWAEEDFWQGG